MQTVMGFWVFQRRSSLLGGHYGVFYVDNGFGELVPSECPVHSIETSNA